MIFSSLNLNNDDLIYVQIKDYIKDMVFRGLIPNNSKLPSTRELSQLLNISRNSVVLAYEELKAEGILYSVSGKGTFVNTPDSFKKTNWSVDWSNLENHYTKTANELDIIKSELKSNSQVISFKSISPNGDLFDIEEFKKSFLNRMSLEGHHLLNYGYAKGYKPLIDYLLDYMNKKGVDTTNKDILITNGFTEGLDIILSSFTQKGDYIVCENPTHNTAIKIMKALELNIIDVDVNSSGIDINMINKKLDKIDTSKIKFSYITPSYHNPTGVVMSAQNRFEFYHLMKDNNIPIIEDGFNEELLYSSSHVFPICSLDNLSNGVIYIGSFSKVLFPGLRIGWILADKNVISRLESVKRCKNIHVSFLDQGILYDYLLNGGFDKYIKKVKKFYKEKFTHTLECAKKYIPCDYILGDGGLHIFIKLNNIDSRELLDKCSSKGVIFMPGDIFYINDSGQDTLRLGFSRLSFEDIEYGIKVIGETIKEIKTKD